MDTKPRLPKHEERGRHSEWEGHILSFPYYFISIGWVLLYIHFVLSFSDVKAKFFLKNNRIYTFKHFVVLSESVPVFLLPSPPQSSRDRGNSSPHAKQSYIKPFLWFLHMCKIVVLLTMAWRCKYKSCISICINTSININETRQFPCASHWWKMPPMLYLIPRIKCDIIWVRGKLWNVQK